MAFGSLETRLVKVYKSAYANIIMAYKYQHKIINQS